MAGWRVAKSILTLHEQLKRGAPNAAPPATPLSSWGTIGDVLHDTTSLREWYGKP